MQRRCDANIERLIFRPQARDNFGNINRQRLARPEKKRQDDKFVLSCGESLFQRGQLNFRCLSAEMLWVDAGGVKQ